MQENAPNPKEKFEETMRGVNEHKDEVREARVNKELDNELEKDNAEADDEAEKILQNLEKKQTVDKSIGQQKISVTREQHMQNKNKQAQMQAFQQLKNSAQNVQSHLSNNQLSVMRAVLQAFEDEKVEDPVLLHLIKRKIKLSKQYVEAQVASKEMYQQLMTRMQKVSENIMKSKGAIESVDQEIFSFVEENELGFK